MLMMLRRLPSCIPRQAEWTGLNATQGSLVCLRLSTKSQLRPLPGSSVAEQQALQANQETAAGQAAHAVQRGLTLQAAACRAGM